MAAWDAHSSQLCQCSLSNLKYRLQNEHIVHFSSSKVVCPQRSALRGAGINAAAMPPELDRAALLGSGSGAEPRGVVNTSGIGTTALDGALTSYALILAACTALLTANAGEPTAAIMHPRDEGTLAGLTDTTGQPLRLPPRIEALQMLTTTNIATNGGDGEDESMIVMGDFRRLLIGIRTELRIEVLRERYADAHQFAFVAHLRADVALEHPAPPSTSSRA